MHKFAMCVSCQDVIVYPINTWDSFYFVWLLIDSIDASFQLNFFQAKKVRPFR